MIVVDASALIPALIDDGRAGDLSRSRLAGESLAAPELIDLEVVSALRGLARARKVSTRRAVLALEDLGVLPIDRAPHRALLERCWELRSTMTPYDAAYVALSEAMDAVLVTADARLSRAPGLRCRIEVLTA